MCTYTFTQGAHPPFPDDLWKDNVSGGAEYDAIEAMKKAILMAWTRDPLERPSAREISNHLHAALVQQEQQDDPPLIRTRRQEQVVRVDIPPLPPNHRFTESDFYKQQRSP
jgi:hypothetical protein